MNELSDYLKKKRNKRKLNFKEFSKILNINSNVYGKIETGKRSFSSKHLIKIAIFFKCRIAEIVRMNNGEM